MNQPFLLHVVERLESFVGKLPEKIQRPILSELTPLKELFLRQRPPRIVFAGSNRISLGDVFSMMLGTKASEPIPLENFVWQDVSPSEQGTMSILDAREADRSKQASVQVEEELNRQPADVILFLDDSESARGPRKQDIDNLVASLDWSGNTAKVVGIAFSAERVAPIKKNLETKKGIGDCLLQVVELPGEAKQLMSILARELPDEARIEMVRISRDKEAQHQIAQVLVKSTTAICTAIGAQPIPLADMPILTTLQLVMVSGIMYVSGRERSLRAATEFIGALGANVGAGMLLREGTRAILKFFPGWGNVVCGMVAGAGTYSIGRAAIIFFVEGASLKDARKTYLASRKRPERLLLPGRAKKKRRPKAK
jgi:uncharacterized protein (DUF697 family)